MAFRPNRPNAGTHRDARLPVNFRPVARSTRAGRIAVLDYVNRAMIQETPDRRSTPLQEFLHLSALNAFGLVQPILERLADNPGFLRGSGYSGTAVFVTTMFLLTVIPVNILLVITTLRWRGWARAATFVFRFTTGALSVMTLMIAARWLSRSADLLGAGIPDTAMSVFAVCGGLSAVWLYCRSCRYRQILSLCSMGAVLFPLNFFFGTAAIRDHVFGSSAQDDRVQIVARTPAPVIMIVFDGLCGMALLNEKHEIDRDCYPSFARLADMSSFYRNATTVHTRTDHALPAILSSCVPEEYQRPVEADYPTNLFRLIYETGQYDMSIFEPFTHFCDDELVKVTRKGGPLTEQTGHLLNTLLRVYAQISIPQDWTSLDVRIPKEWFGILPQVRSDRSLRDGQIAYPWDSWRGVQCEHFADCLDRNEKPCFRFLHLIAPHDPWNLLPSGKTYTRFSEYEDSVFGSKSETWCDDELLVNQAWQRYLLQLQFADQWLGRFLDRLEETGQLDEALIVVTADHGMAFAPGTSRRIPSVDTLPDIISVPLFIKQPGQQTAVISDMNVETIDILPTIAEILGLPGDSAWDGSSLLSQRAPRQRKLIRNPDTVINPEFSERFRYVERMAQVFGAASTPDRLWNLNTIPELVGIQISAVAAGPPVNYRCQLASGGTELDPRYPNYVPCRFQGMLSETPRHSPPRQLALSLNGVILATTRTSTDPAFLNKWSILLPDTAFHPDGNHVQLFEVESQEQTYILHEIPLVPFDS